MTTGFSTTTSIGGDASGCSDTRTAVRRLFSVRSVFVREAAGFEPVPECDDPGLIRVISLRAFSAAGAGGLLHAEHTIRVPTNGTTPSLSRGPIQLAMMPSEQNRCTERNAEAIHRRCRHDVA